MPVLLLSAGQAGATAPAALAGAIVQEVAEVLAGLAYVNAIKPGHPAIFGLWPFVSDLRTGAMIRSTGASAGSPKDSVASSMPSARTIVWTIGTVCIIHCSLRATHPLIGLRTGHYAI